MCAGSQVDGSAVEGSAVEGSAVEASAVEESVESSSELGGGSAGRRLEQPLVVASFNIRSGSAAGSLLRPSLRPTAATVSRLGAHIVGLQEVDRHAPRSAFRDQTRWLAARIGASGEFAMARRLPVGGLYGVALLCAFPVSAVENRLLPTERGREPRVGLLASVVTPEGRITVAVTHLHNVAAPIPPGGGLAGRQLADLLDATAERPGPHLVMGDLNLDVDHVVPIADRHGFRAVRCGPTFPAGRPRRQLDWFLVRGLDVVDPTVVDERTSDHRPIRGRLELGDRNGEFDNPAGRFR